MWLDGQKRPFPMQTYLHTINQIKHSLFSTPCGHSGYQTWKAWSKESLSHISSSCLMFSLLGQQLTNCDKQVCKVLSASLSSLSKYGQLHGLIIVKLTQSDSVGVLACHHFSCTTIREGLGGKCRIQTLQQQKWILEGGNLILWQYHIQKENCSLTGCRQTVGYAG